VAAGVSQSNSERQRRRPLAVPSPGRQSYLLRRGPADRSRRSGQLVRVLEDWSPVDPGTVPLLSRAPAGPGHAARPHRYDPHGARLGAVQTFTPEPLHEELSGVARRAGCPARPRSAAQPPRAAGALARAGPRFSAGWAAAELAQFPAGQGMRCWRAALEPVYVQFAAIEVHLLPFQVGHFRCAHAVPVGHEHHERISTTTSATARRPPLCSYRSAGHR
jgi:hypothetical protein